MLKIFIFFLMLLIFSWGLELEVKDSNVTVSINGKVKKYKQGDVIQLGNNDKICLISGKGYIDTKKEETIQFLLNKRNQCQIAPKNTNSKQSYMQKIREYFALIFPLKERQKNAVSRGKGTAEQKYTKSIILNKSIRYIYVNSEIWIEPITVKLIDKNNKVIFIKKAKYNKSDVIKCNIPIYKYKNAKKLIIYDDFKNEVVNSLIVFK